MERRGMMVFIWSSVWCIIIHPLPLASVMGEDGVTVASSAYDYIKRYNLPPGLLPKGVVAYDYQVFSGQLFISLNTWCHIRVLGDYKVKYAPVFGGMITDGQIQGVEGVKVEIASVWLDLMAVHRINGHQLQFIVSNVTTRNFPVSDFDVSPSCNQ